MNKKKNRKTEKINRTENIHCLYPVHRKIQISQIHFQTAAVPQQPSCGRHPKAFNVEKKSKNY